MGKENKRPNQKDVLSFITEQLIETRNFCETMHQQNECVWSCGPCISGGCVVSGLKTYLNLAYHVLLTKEELQELSMLK